MAKLTKNEKYIVDMYVRYFGKAPSVAEIAKYDAFGKQKLILEEISGEAKASKAGLTTEEIVNSTFQNLFGRNADPKEMNKYSKVVDAEKDLPINSIVKSAKKDDKGVFEAKKAIAIMLAEKENTTNYNLDKITKDTYKAVYDPKTKKPLVDSVADLETKIDAIPDNGNATGQTFTLTADSGDILVLTAKNDKVEAGTFLDGKTIIDQGGNDTINATLNADLANTTTVSGVENININWDAFSTPTINAYKIKGATITLTSSKLGYLGDATVAAAGNNNVVAGAGIKGALTVKGVTTGNVNAANAKTVTVDAKNGTTDDSTTVTAGATTTTMTVGNTTAFDNATVIAGAATTDITVKGDKTVNVTTDALTKAVTTTSNATTINAAKIAKDATITLNKGAEASTATITLGDNATVTNLGTALGGKITLDVAAGKTVTLTSATTATAETFDIKGTGDVTLKATAANLTTDTITKSNTGTLTVDTTSVVLGAAVDTSKVAADLIKVKAATAGGAQITAKSGQSFEASAESNASVLTVGVATDGSADTLNLKLTSAAYAKLTNNATNDIETLTIEAAAAQATGAATAIDLTITDLVAGDNKVVLTGTNDVKISTITSAKEIDASALNGTLNVGSGIAVDTGVIAGATGVNTIAFGDIAADKSVTFVGQGGNDVITLKTTAAKGVGSKAGQANIVAGAGDDRLTVSGAIEGVLSAQMGAGNDTVKLETAPIGTVVIEFGEGTDTLDLTGSGSGIDVSGAASLVLTGLENIKIDGTGAKFNGSTLNGQKYTILGTDGSTDKFTVSTGATDENIDLSGLTVTDSVSTGILGAIITGGTGVNVLTGTTRDDTFIGGAGNDTINLSTGGNDTVVFTGGATTAAVKAANGIDTITGFGSTDTLNIGSLGDGTTTVTGLTTVTAAAGQGALVDDTVAIITTTGAAANLTTGGTATLSEADLTASTLTNLAAYLSERYTTTDDAAQENVFVINFGTKAYVYHLDTIASQSTAIEANEIALVGIVDANLASTNLVYA